MTDDKKKVTSKAKKTVTKFKKPTEAQVSSLHELVRTSKAHQWAMPKFLGELRKLGVYKLETCIISAKSWFYWEDGTMLEHEYKSFKPYKVLDKVDKAKVAEVCDYAQKDGLDYLHMFDMMAKAGVHFLVADLKTGKVGFYYGAEKGDHKLAGSFKVKVAAKSLRHPHYDELLTTFQRSADESWPHSKLYGAIAKLGLDAFDFDLGPKVTTFLWSDGTKDFFDESAHLKSKLTVAPKLDKKKLSALVKDFKANKLEYPDFVANLSKAGVKRYTTSVKAEKITYQGKDLKNTVEEKIELA